VGLLWEQEVGGSNPLTPKGICSMICNYNIFIQFGDGDIMEYGCLHHTEAEILKTVFKDAVEEGFGAKIEYITIKLSKN
jgi:hypothetical protein